MDPALEQARQKAAAGGDMSSQMQQAAANEEQRRAEEESRKGALQGIISVDARARLGRIALIHPEKARAIEDRILTLAQQGRLGGVIQDKHIIDMLSDIDSQREGIKVTIKHRGDESDEEDLLDGL